VFALGVTASHARGTTVAHFLPGGTGHDYP
jgi:hypothetical protein